MRRERETEGERQSRGGGLPGLALSLLDSLDFEYVLHVNRGVVIREDNLVVVRTQLAVVLCAGRFERVRQVEVRT